MRDTTRLTCTDKKLVFVYTIRLETLLMRSVISRRLEITLSLFFSVKICRKIPQTSGAYSRTSMPPKKKKHTEAADGNGATAEDLRFEDVEDNFTEIAVYMDHDGVRWQPPPSCYQAPN